MKSPCQVAGCIYPKIQGRHKCLHHWLLRQPIELQEAWAAHRRRKAQERPGYAYRARVPERDWDPGTRWCSGCQSMIPVWACDGSRCKACASRARHRAYVEKTYNITGETYDRLLDAQAGRCAICGEMPRTVRLAVDHDHITNEVRGLLCAGREQGCNWNYRKALGNTEVARRILAYAEKPPLARVLAGEPWVASTAPKLSQQDLIRQPVLGVSSSA